MKCFGTFKPLAAAVSLSLFLTVSPAVADQAALNNIQEMVAKTGLTLTEGAIQGILAAPNLEAAMKLVAFNLVEVTPETLLSALQEDIQLAPELVGPITAAYVAAAQDLDPSLVPMIVQAAIVAAPAEAAAIVQAAVTVAPGQAAGIVQAAVTAAPEQATSIVQAAITAAPEQATSIVQAAVTAAPEQAQAIVQAAVEAAPEQATQIQDAAIAALPPTQTNPDTSNPTNQIDNPNQDQPPVSES